MAALSGEKRGCMRAVEEDRSAEEDDLLARSKKKVNRALFVMRVWRNWRILGLMCNPIL